MNNTIALYKKIYEGACSNGAPLDSVDAILVKYSINEPVYREWLIHVSGGPIGSDWYDGLDELEESQTKFDAEDWNMKGFIIGWDGWGNPIALQSNGTIAIEDHNFGGIHKIANNFKELLTKGVSS